MSHMWFWLNDGCVPIAARYEGYVEFYLTISRYENQGLLFLSYRSNGEPV